MTELLTVIAIIFVVAAPFLLLADYLRLPTAPALIVSGLVAGMFIDPALKLDIARLGIALLVFTFAARIQTTDVRTVVADSEVVALVQLAVLGGLGFGLGYLVGLTPGEAMFIGIAAAISSSLVGSSLFLPGELEHIHDRLSESIHAIQDFAALFILLIVSAGVFEIDPIATQIGYGVLLLIGAVAINRYLFDLMGRFSGKSTESLIVSTVALLLVFLGLAEYLGLSIVVGAFAAGLAIKYDFTNYSEMINGLESISDFFAAIFFITVGSLVTMPDMEGIVLTVVLIGLVGVVKPAITIWLVIQRGYERRTATLTGFNLDQVGEFALIIAIEALVLNLLTESVFNAIILAAAVTLITSSFTRVYEERIYRILVNAGLLGEHGRRFERSSDVADDLQEHVIIVGYGRHGRRLVAVCEDHDQPYVVIESNPALLDELRRGCQNYVFGDVIERHSREMAHVDEAMLIISTIDTKPVNNEIIRLSEQLDVIIRTKSISTAKGYLDQGALYVSVSDLLAADRLADRFEALLEGTLDRESFRADMVDGEAIDRRDPTGH